MLGSTTNLLSPDPLVVTRHIMLGCAVLCSMVLVDICDSTAKASESSPEAVVPTQTGLIEMLQDSGIPRLYADVAATVIAETHVARLSCEESTAYSDDVQSFISDTLNVDQMMDKSVVYLSQHIEPSVLNEMANWMTSAAGLRIQEAEAQAATWSDDEFERREQALAIDMRWNPARQELITRVLDTAGTVSFVTALHSESSALVLYASDCVATDVSRASIESRVRKARSDEGFYSVFLRNGMVMTAAMIFCDISDSHLNAYVKHSESSAGRAWNKALLASVRQVLQERHGPIQRFLAAKRESVSR